MEEGWYARVVAYFWPENLHILMVTSYKYKQADLLRPPSLTNMYFVNGHSAYRFREKVWKTLRHPETSHLRLNREVA